MFGSAATGPVSQFSRTAHQDRIHQLDCVVAMTGNQNILLSFALYESDPFLDRKPAAQLRKQISAVIAANFADSIHKPGWSFRYAQRFIGDGRG